MIEGSLPPLARQQTGVCSATNRRPPQWPRLRRPAGGKVLSMDERERKVERRAVRRVAGAAVLGALIGALLGLATGAAIFAPWNAGDWTMALAGAILGGGIASVQGGLSGLESVNPGREPAEHDRPVREVRSWTSPERDERRHESRRGKV
jgi:hypothetical protein